MDLGMMFTAFIACCMSLVSGVERNLKCEVSNNSTHVKYRILGGDYNLTENCRYSFANATKHVAATNTSPSGPEFSSSVNGLNVSQCLGDVSFKASCKENGFALDYIANCTVNCSALAPVHQEKDVWIPPVAVTSGLAALAIGIGTGIIALCIYKIKKKGCRFPVFYNPVAKDDNNPMQTDVEMGNQ